MSSAIDEGKLIWRRSIIDSVVLSFLSLFDISDDGMTKTKCFQEILHVLMIWMSYVLELFLQHVVLEVDVRDPRSILYVL